MRLAYSKYNTVNPAKVAKCLLHVTKACIGLFLISTYFQVVTAQTKFEPVRINCGGSRYVDPVTKFVWINDSTKYVTSGTQVSSCSDRFLVISNTTKSMREVYCSNRSFKQSSSPLSNIYTIPVLNTTESYVVRLHFAEMVCHVAFVV
jgi:hypothetical protein